MRGWEDAAALQKAVVSVRQEQANTAALLDSTNDLIWSVDREFVLTACNAAFLQSVERHSGRRPERGDCILDATIFPAEQIGFWHRLYRDVLEGQTVYTELHTPFDGVVPESWLELNLNPIVHGFEVTGVACFGRDVTQRRRTEMYTTLTKEVLRILSERHDETTTLQRVVDALKLHTGFDAVGIRMRHGEDFPYVVHDGFPEDFLATENTLLDRGTADGVCRDEDGSLRLGCTCGLVLSGRADVTEAYLTPGGSCWTSDSVRDGAAMRDGDPRFMPRDRCIHDGYASMALIPVRITDKIVGLIHLGDKRKGRLDVETVEFLEAIAAHVGAAMLLMRSEDELLLSEGRHRAAVRTAMDGFWLSDVEGHILTVNQAYCAMSGYAEDELVGMHMSELVGGSSPDELITRSASIMAVGSDRFDSQHRRKDGSIFDVEISVSYSSLGEGWFAAFIRDVTERNSSNAAIHLSRQQYHAVIETSPDGFVLCDGKGYVLEVNDFYMQMSGYSREELEGVHIFDLWEISEQQASETIEQLSLSGAQIFETEHRTKDGICRLVEASVAYWPIDGGRFFVFVRDIVALRRAELLMRVRARLAEIDQSSDVDGLLQAALDEAERLTGSSIGFFHFVDADEAHLTLQMWSTNTLATMCQADHKGAHYAVDEAGVWADCVHKRATVVHNDYASLANRKGLPQGHAPISRELVVPVIREGIIVAIMGVGNKGREYDAADVEVVEAVASNVVDLALRKKTEVELANFFELVPDVVCTVTADGTFHRVNAGWERSLGYRRDELVGRRFLELLHPDDVDATRSQFAAESRNLNEVKGFVNRCRAADGSFHSFEWNAARMTDGYIFAAARDITERLADHERDERYQERLRSLAAELVASGERERGRLGVELHDGVGQVLVAAKLTAQLLAAEPLGEAAQARADALVALLGESISEARLLTAELAPTVLFELGLESALLWLRDRYFQLYGLESTVYVDAGSAHLRGDSEMFVFRLVREGLNNVVRHSGVLTATVSADIDGDWRAVSVTDQGVGFDTSLVDDPGETGGFGLFSVREECLDRGGLFEVLSAPGSGTRIKVRIPVDGVASGT